MRPAPSLDAALDLDLRGYPQPLLEIRAADSTSRLYLETVALDIDGDQNRHQSIRLEPAGVSWLSLEGQTSFEQLRLRGSAPFVVEIEDTVRGDRRRFASESSSGALRGASSSNAEKGFVNSTVCDRPWRLSCIAPAGCTYVSPFYPGRVESGDQVYWNLHQASGSWTTTVGSCVTHWYNINAEGCPTRADNCHGETYLVAAPPVLAPDLVVQNVTVSPGSVASGGQVDVTYDIVNLGNAAAPAGFRQRVRLIGPGTSQDLFTTLSSQSLAAGGTQPGVVSSLAVFGGAGSYTLQVEADATSTVAESNEGNNTGGAPLTLTAAFGELTLDGLTYRPSSNQPWQYALHNCPVGSPCIRTFTIRNTGQVTAIASITDNSGKPTLVSHNCPSFLPTGQSCTLTINHTMLQAGRDLGGNVDINQTPQPYQADYPICIASNNSDCR